MSILERLRFLVSRIGERLWVKPLVACVLSIAVVFLAKLADRVDLGTALPPVNVESLEALLSIMASSMLVIATFAVASMVSAYASASTGATPRSFSVVVADDVSQNALSIFIGAFIFSIVALTVLKNDFFQETGRFVLFGMTVSVFAVVVLTFVRWVDQIARLGRLGTSIEKVEAAAASAMRRRRAQPRMGGVPVTRREGEGRPVEATRVGYVQRVDVAALQTRAEAAGGWVAVAALPGTFAMKGRPLAYVGGGGEEGVDFDPEKLADAFVIGHERLFDEDPRFGVVVLAEIADKALSPGVNDPGTAIAIIGTLVRLFTDWAEPLEDPPEPRHERVQVPELASRDLFEDGFTAIARDGAGLIEVVVRLQKALDSLASLGDPAMGEAAVAHARLSLARAERALELPEDRDRARDAAAFAASRPHAARGAAGPSSHETSPPPGRRP